MKYLVVLVLALLVGSTLYIYKENEAGNGVEEGKSTGQAAIGGAFSLVDQDGKAVTEKTYLGKNTLIFFGFTHCTNVCLIAANTMGQAMKKLTDEERAGINMLFVTLDPERDTPEVMKKWLNDYDPRMIGLTGTKENVEAAKAAYKVYSQIRREKPGDKDYQVDHSSYMYLMDGEGNYITHLPHDVPLEKLLDTIRKNR